MRRCAQIGCADDGGVSLPGRDAFPATPRITACAMPVEAENPYQGTFSLSGLVTETGIGDAPDDCFRRSDAYVGRGIPDPATAAGAFWLRGVDDRGKAFTVGLVVDGFTPPAFTAGDRVTAVVRRTEVVFAGRFDDFELRGPAGELLAWVSASVPDLSGTPPVHIERGALVGREPSGGCEYADLFDSTVTIGATTAEVPLYGATTIAGFHVVSGGYANPVLPRGCPPPPDGAGHEGFLLGLTAE